MSFQGKFFIFIAQVLKKGILFYKKIQLTYPQREMEGSLLEQRPDLYLGRFLSMFADIVFGQYANLDDTDVSISPTRLWAAFASANYLMLKLCFTNSHIVANSSLRDN